MTTYFINDQWQYRKTLLTFIFLQNNHSEQSLTRKIVRILKFYNLQDLLLIIINDNANKHYTMLEFIAKFFNELNVTWNHQINFVFCLTHVVQLIAQTLMTELKTTAVNDNLTAVFKNTFINDMNADVSLSNILLKISKHF